MLLENEGFWRFGVFAAIFVIMAVLEAFFPRRKQNFKRSQRWFSNIGIMALNGVLARIVLPWLPVGVALYAQENEIGFLREMPIFVAILVLDLCIYLQHIAMHKVPLLWRLHRLHHADLDYDVTTGVRFHPIEIILSLLFKMGIILLLGIDPIGVILFEMILNAMAMFNHANFALPKGVDKYLRLVFVTPDFHRVHHSVIMKETDSNYGFNISLWDRLFRTYTTQPEKGHREMDIGLEYFRDEKQLGLIQMLIQPFVGKSK